MGKSDVFVKTARQRFEVATVKEVNLGVGGTFKAEEVGTLGSGSGDIP